MVDTSSMLRLDVFVAPTKQITPNFLPDAPPGGLTWPPTTATLISGSRHAVLVDALFTSGEARDLGNWIAASGKTVTTIYITHAHSDHYFGLTTLLQQFPQAKAVALPSVVEAIDPRC
jgi:glyoxylase-like metal-dependent hydrolase (beta-lactamase superfamily II)